MYLIDQCVGYTTEAEAAGQYSGVGLHALKGCFDGREDFVDFITAASSGEVLISSEKCENWKW